MLSLIARLAAIQSIYFVLLMFSSRLMQSFQIRFIKGTDWPLWSERIQPVFTFALVSPPLTKIGSSHPFFAYSSQLQSFTHLVLVDDDNDEDEVDIKR